ncbi:hypothetical protein ADIMK_4144 [Marinobacterium lacunae]|uniref:Uncharacterized protein n=1 Tax=Marinobacterium lacunae TaxID=1232683 RepID=A0A081FT32_9GAMM|nr:hypothetical protein ADIMK_4144 [Marinobacterium lacunae]
MFLAPVCAHLFTYRTGSKSVDGNGQQVDQGLQRMISVFVGRPSILP